MNKLILNSHIKVNINTSPCLKNWIENDIYIINDLLNQNKQIMSYEIFQGFRARTLWISLYWKHDNLLFFDNEKDSEKIRPHSVSSISNSFHHLLILFTGTTVLWLNSHIKVNINTSPCLKNWIENDIYTIDDVLYQNKQIMN
jgi:hypothetical protein